MNSSRAKPTKAEQDFKKSSQEAMMSEPASEDDQSRVHNPRASTLNNNSSSGRRTHNINEITGLANVHQGTAGGSSAQVPSGIIDNYHIGKLSGIPCIFQGYISRDVARSLIDNQASILKVQAEIDRQREGESRGQRSYTAGPQSSYSVDRRN